MKLFNLVYECEKKRLKSYIIPENATSTELTREFGKIVLRIDIEHRNPRYL